MGCKVFDISGGPVTRKEVEEALKPNPNALFIFYNHGSSDCLWGSVTEKLIDLQNVKLLSNREVYTVACLSAKKLGSKAYAEGCIAYWGYTAEFTFSTEAIKEFQQFANCGIKFKLERKSWSECLKLAKELAKQLASKLTREGKYFSAVLMEHDSEVLVCYNAHPPETKCPLRKLAIKLFGPRRGWKISVKNSLSFLLFGFGLGIAIHDFFIECPSPLRIPPHSFWYGITLILVAFIIANLNSHSLVS